VRPLSIRATGLARARDRALADARAAANAGDVAAHARAADRADAAEDALAGLLLPDEAGPSVAARGLLNGAAILGGGRAGVRECGQESLPAVGSFW